MKTTLRAFTVAAFAAFAAMGATHAATYSPGSIGKYTSKQDAATCTVGVCHTYTLNMAASATFTTAAPLAPNLTNANISGQITSFSFSDGVSTFASSDANVRLYVAEVSTSATGQITGAFLIVERWQTGTPHSAGDRVDLFALTSLAAAYNNHICLSTGTSPASGVADVCTNIDADSNSSSAFGGAVTWIAPAAPVAKSIPTVSEWGLIIMSALMGVAGLVVARRKKINPIFNVEDWVYRFRHGTHVPVSTYELQLTKYPSSSTTSGQ